MRMTELELIKGRDKFEAAVIRALNNGYDATTWKEKDADGWCLTELLLSESRAARAAVCLLTGDSTDGKLLTREAMPQAASQMIPIRVLSRRACYADRMGNVLDTNPRNPKCVSADEKPQPGDVVRVSQGMLTRDPDSGERLTPAHRASMAMKGRDLKAFRSYTVDADGFITVDIPDALHLLQQFSRLSYRPQFSALRLVSQGLTAATVNEVQILNWLFEEAPKPEKPVTTENVYPSGRGARKAAE